MIRSFERQRSFRKGSAYLIVIGVISVILVIVLGFFRGNIARHFTTRIMSNEKRAEALAESVAELVLRRIKDTMNDPSEANFYPLFRYPLVFDGASNFKSGDASGKANVPLDIDPYSTPLTFDLVANPTTEGLEAAQSLITEMGGTSHVTKLNVDVEVIQAEAFSSKKDDYQVAAVSVKHAPAQGDSAKMLDKLTPTAPSYGALSQLVGVIDFQFYLPNTTLNPLNVTTQDQHEIDVDAGIFSGLVDATVYLTKLSATKVRARIRVECPGHDIDESKEIDFEEVFKKYVDIGARPLALSSILDMIMGSTDLSRDWGATVFNSAANNGYSAIPGAIKGKINGGSPFSPPQVVEKGLMLRVTVEVEYKPQGAGGKTILRTLIADREFKVSDIQPVGPEYTFFVANSDLVNEDFSMGLGTPIKWYEAPPNESTPAIGIATISIHHIPQKKYDTLDGLSGGSSGADSTCQVPGMLRVNANGKMTINTFLGTKDEPTLTEYNALAGNKFVAKPFQLVPMFQWKDKSPVHEVDFPVVKHLNRVWSPYNPYGVETLKNLLDFCDALTAPTLLFGDGHFEYPLGLKGEAYLDMRHANVKVRVDPRGQDSSPKDITRTYIDYKNLEKPYGLPGLPSYDGSCRWDPVDYTFMPANLYSTLQYAKKADHFYEDEGQFWADAERFSGGVYDCTGVTYVKGNLNIGNAPGSEFKVKGKGLLVVKGNITATKDVKRQGAPGETVFGLIARQGALNVTGACHRIEAACYSNSSVYTAAGHGLVIDGNLVTNDFQRSFCHSLEVFYNGPACRISPLSVIRDVGKYEPKRYHVSVGKKWSRFEFLKQ
ncbi:MAG: hypothetical protein GX442_02940 [Candidatus Riflebacteria bacterium]|nr:hypothetical protein [Candidatus Riflebacteria bacterium]